jgi:hypothetical protein
MSTRKELPRSRRWTLVLLGLFLLAGLSVVGVGSRVLAQPGEAVLRQSSGQALRQDSRQVWSEPVNLSHSGAASEPVVVAGPDGTLQVFWWDQLDGLTTARWDGEVWSAAVASPIRIYQQVGEELTIVPIGAMPLLTADAGGRAHAFWLGEPDRKTGAQPLMHSRLEIGSTTWSAPRAVTESALVWHLEADPAGTLHLAYVRPQHSDTSPAGVYYTRSTDGGVMWSAPKVLYSSMYFRLLSPEEAHVHVAAGSEGQVYVTWDDPRLETAFYALSTDGGLAWEESRAVGDPEEGAKWARVVVGQDGRALLLWEAIRAAAPCALYQQHADDGGTPQRVLEELVRCPEEMGFLRTATGQVLLVTSDGGEGLMLAARDVSVDQWSEPKLLGFSFEDPELDRQVYLVSLRATLAGEALAVVGQGQGGDVWFLESQVSALEWAFAPSSPWSEPVGLSQSEGLPGLPAVATDAEGRVHVLWSEATGEGLPAKGLQYAGYSGARWTRPAEVLRSPEGKAEQPALVAVGDRLHVVWSGGRSGEIFYSRAYVRDAYLPDGWSEPQPLPAPGDVGSEPVIVADLAGTLHVVYAVPLNEERGIYYTLSDDSGETWSEAQVIFDAAAAGWVMVDHPSLAVDGQGTLHVGWVRAPLPGSGLPEGVYYARSGAGGESLRPGTPRPRSGRAWSEPVQVAAGAYDWPRVVAAPTGQVHLLWGEASGGLGWIHQWSVDGGVGWTLPESAGRFAGVPGPVGLAADGAGTLHLVGVGKDDVEEPALLYTTWDGSAVSGATPTTGGGRWSELETFRLTPGTSSEPGLALALRSELGRLDVTFRSGLESEEGEEQVDVFYASRSVPAVEVIPLPAFTPQPTVVSTPGFAPTATPTPRPAVNPVAPSPAPPTLSLGPVNLPLVSLGGLFLAALMVVVVGILSLRPPWVRRRR